MQLNITINAPNCHVHLLPGIPTNVDITEFNVLGAAEDAATTGTTPQATGSLGVIPDIGQLWAEQGGIRLAYMPPQDGQPGYSIIGSRDSAAHCDNLKWGGSGDVEGLSTWDGKANTEKLVAAGGHPAAEFCNKVVIGDHRDFYLPARREASLISACSPDKVPPGWHWTSTQYSSYTAFVQGFSGGGQDTSGKGIKCHVLAVRRVIH